MALVPSRDQLARVPGLLPDRLAGRPLLRAQAPAQPSSSPRLLLRPPSTNQQASQLLSGLFLCLIFTTAPATTRDDLCLVSSFIVCLPHCVGHFCGIRQRGETGTFFIDVTSFTPKYIVAVYTPANSVLQQGPVFSTSQRRHWTLPVCVIFVARGTKLAYFAYL